MAGPVRRESFNYDTTGFDGLSKWSSDVIRELVPDATSAATCGVKSSAMLGVLHPIKTFDLVTRFFRQPENWIETADFANDVSPKDKIRLVQAALDYEMTYNQRIALQTMGALGRTSTQPQYSKLGHTQMKKEFSEDFWNPDTPLSYTPSQAAVMNYELVNIWQTRQKMTRFSQNDQKFLLQLSKTKGDSKKQSLYELFLNIQYMSCFTGDEIEEAMKKTGWSYNLDLQYS